MPSSYAIKNLTHEALSKHHLDRCNIAALTRSFVASQARHASAYAIEGKKIASRWNSGPGSETMSSTGAAALDTRTTHLGGGFSSPILKPRNPKCAEVSQKYLHTPPAEKATRKGDESGKMLLNDEERKKDESGSGRTVKKQSGSPKQDTRNPKTKEKTSNPRVQKRKRSDSDDERDERLKQRRIRRQNKKEITTTPKARTEVESALSGDEVEESNRLKRKSKLPAGLALMHGFSAGNIGKHRLTVGPVATFGVFNKGRASAKTKIEKKSKCKKTSATFNELCFLNKSAPRGVSKSTPKPSGDTRSDSSSILPHGEGQSTRLQEHTPETKKVPTVISLSSSSSQQRLGSDAKSKYESEVWEIEKEFLQNRNDTSKPDADTVQESKSLDKPCSVVINSKLWGWDIPEDEGQAENVLKFHSATDSQAMVQKQTDSPKNALGSRVGSSTSLAPSQSASQIPARLSYKSATPPLTSKFFPVSKDDKLCDPEVPSAAKQQSVSPPCEQSTPSSRDVKEGNMGSSLPSESCDRKLNAFVSKDLQEDTPLQRLSNECRSVGASACSIEGAIRRLEAEDSNLRPLACWNDVQSSPSLFDTELIFEDQPKATLADESDVHCFRGRYDYTDPCNIDTLSDYALTDDSCSENNRYMHNGEPLAHPIYGQLPPGAIPGVEMYERMDFQDDDVDPAENSYPIGYESVDDNNSYSHYDTYQLTEHESEIEDATCNNYALCDWDRPQESTQSQTSSDNFSEISGGEHEQQSDHFDSDTMTENFGQGRYMLFGSDGPRSRLGLGVQELPRKPNIYSQIGSLEDAEASVAREMQNSWFPVKF